jgi:hypothetical protein
MPTSLRTLSASALVLGLGIAGGTLAGPSAASASTAAAATTCYGGAKGFTVHISSYGGESPEFTTSSRCADINVRIISGTSSFLGACVRWTVAGGDNCAEPWTADVTKSWNEVATNVKDGTKFRILFVDPDHATATYNLQVAA